jgi:hypothetical protein
MAETAVTVVRCGRCGRTGDITATGERLWCAWCQDWAAVEAVRVLDATVRTVGKGPALVRPERAGFSLQPLRVPAGWLMEYNNGLYEVDPTPELVPEPDRWWVFKQDMLQMKHARLDRLLDLGWYPEGDLACGRYGLVVHEGDFRGRCLHEYDTRDRYELVAEIERLLVAVCNGHL